MKIALAALAAVLAAGSAAAETTVQVNQVRRLPLAAAAADVVVGNPEIADVTVVDGRNVFVVGRAYGVTSVVVLDAAGRTVFSDSVQVLAPTVSMARGGAIAEVVCNPRCAAAQGAADGPTMITGSRAPSFTPPPAAPAASVALPEAPAGAAASGVAAPPS